MPPAHILWAALPWAYGCSTPVGVIAADAPLQTRHPRLWRPGLRRSSCSDGYGSHRPHCLIPGHVAPLWDFSTAPLV